MSEAARGSCVEREGIGSFLKICQLRKLRRGGSIRVHLLEDEKRVEREYYWVGMLKI
jgi:hypothetical protein